MPRLFCVSTRVHMYLSAYAIKIIKKYIKNPYFRAGLMVTLVVQPPQHVANCFQLIETTLREYKSPSCVWPKGGRNSIDIILCWNPSSSLIPRASCTFPDLYQETLVSWRCSSIYMPSRVHKSWKNLSEARAGWIRTTVCLKIVEGFRWSLHFYYCTCYS